MQIISGTTEFECKHHTAVAIGKFDGIHQGHRMLLSQILKAKEDGLQSAVFTFDPPPGVFFSGKPQAELTTKEEKRRVFDRMGIDLLIEFPMNAETAAMPPETFVREVLHDRLQTRFIAAGTDLSYGDRGKGDWHLLQAMSERMGYQVQVIDKIMYNGREISSTFVREEVQKGNMELAERLLGAPYCVAGNVMHGKRLAVEGITKGAGLLKDGKDAGDAHGEPFSSQGQAPAPKRRVSFPVIRRKQTAERHYKYRLPAYGEQQRPDERGNKSL